MPELLQTTLPYAIAMVVAYLLGSIPTSIWWGRVTRGVDLRRHGSGNAGATNARRVLGWRAALLVFGVDFAKGWLALEFAGWIANRFAVSSDDRLLVLAALAAIAGHIWPCLASFRGGKGVATAAGAVLALEPVWLLGALAVFVAALVLQRQVGRASILAALSLPALLLVLVGLDQVDAGRDLRIFSVVVAALLFWTHRSNLARRRSLD